jgi:hypothetical protein
VLRLPGVNLVEFYYAGFRYGSCDETDPGGAEPPNAPRAPPFPDRRGLANLIQKPLAFQQIEKSLLKQSPVVAGKSPFFA